MNAINKKKQWVSPLFNSEGLKKTKSGSSSFGSEVITSIWPTSTYAPIS